MAACFPLPEMESVFCTHQPIVDQVLHRMMQRGISSSLRDDMRQIGQLALIESILRLDYQASSFGRYVRIRIQGAMLDALRKEDWVPRSVRRQSRLYQQASQHLRIELHRKPSHDELAKFMGVDKAEIVRVLKNIAIPNVQSWDAEQGLPPKERISSANPSPQDEVLHSEYLIEFQKILRDLSTKEKQLIRAYYFLDKTHQDIAEIWGVTASRVSQCHTELKKKLQRRLKNHPYFADGSWI